MAVLKAKLGVFGLLLVLVGMSCGGSQQNSEPAAIPQPLASSPAPAAEPAPALPSEPPPAVEAPVATPRTIEVALLPKSGSKLSGKATLTESPEGVRVAIALENVTPGEHGAHVHEKGDCSAADAASAGGHFNPAGHPHALPTAGPRHLGDLGNISIGKDGTGTSEIVIPGANLKPDDPRSFFGRSIVVHEKVDDGGQPTGNAGGRIGCGEIK